VIDKDTFDRFVRVQQRALHDGVPLIDALDAAGLLATEAQINKQWANCLQQLAFNIDEQPIVALVQLGGGQNTPLDAVRGTLEYIDFFRGRFAAQAGE
jgi:hypothetical protein